MSQPDFIMIKDVRVSFPHLFKKPIIKGEEGKCGATLMLAPNSPEVGEIEATISMLEKTKFKGRSLPSDKKCLRDGEDTMRSEYDGYVILSANHKSKPMVISNNGRDVITEEEDSAIYGGCRVNAKVRLWAQDNDYGKRINAELVAIQFAGDDEPLDGSYVSVEDAVSGFAAIDTPADDPLFA